MLSHLRFHRRAPSNPTSPHPDQATSTWDSAAAHEHPPTAQDASARPDMRPRSPASSQLPPKLPPIARVASADSDILLGLRDDLTQAAQDASPIPPGRPAFDGPNSGFAAPGASQTQGYSQDPRGSQTLDAAGPTGGPLPGSQLSRSKPPPPPINTGFTSWATPASSRPSSKAPSFATPMDLQQGSGGSAAKRPSGMRLATEPATPAAPAPPAPETHKGRKGLPFLKNPVSSLLMRRKTGQSAPSPQPLPFSGESVYDPRIRGTKVHDFSAPRKKKEASSAVASPPVTSQLPTEASTQAWSQPPLDGSVIPPGSAVGTTQPPTVQEQAVPPVPPKDDPPNPPRSSSSIISRASARPASLPTGSASVRTAVSRNVSTTSVSARDSVMSAIPRHMKSTSSRFSFDMVGAAKQEKLLEERHRQREQEKKTTGDGKGFDEYDDDDGFDYDAMMDDDGLEERIPGVNADYEDDMYDVDDADDPDNDQENFAGFVFQRSNPASSLASPHSPAMLMTPRDANGTVIGFAVTKDTTPDLPPTASPISPNPATLPKLEESTSTLCAHAAAEATQVPVADQSVSRPSYGAVPEASQVPRRVTDDDIYFDDGLADELDFEHDGTVFDESIFDNNDTDKYGRPIPGAFAQAKEAMQASQQQTKRDSDLASSMSGQSAAVQSTAHTSVSASAGIVATSLDTRPLEPVRPTDMASQDMAYQAALAEAAQRAAASGKFRRSSSPPLPAEPTVTSPTDSAQSQKDSHLEPYLNDYSDDDAFGGHVDEDYGDDLDDFDFDDEAIIAEANASALANDSDGFYGQEFGFYSAPVQQSHGHGHHGSSGSSSSVLNAENLFQYANGGYFGPAGGLNRSTSGRVVCREPNLTPITERSEYSNRNSIMSLALPPAIGSDGRNSVSLTSPGLAQLALMSDDDGSSMSLSALMKLRSRAWGGSQTSLANSREGSPRSERAADGSSSPFAPGSGAGYPSGIGPHVHARKGSSFSLWSGSEADSGAGSPTMTMSMVLPPVGSPPPVPAAPALLLANNGVLSPMPQHPTSMLSPPPSFVHMSTPSPGLGGGGTTCSPVLEGEEGTSPVDGVDNLCAGEQQQPEQKEQEKRPGMGHRHKGSAESVSYVMDEEGGGKRWVVERRRTAESGEVEILGREVLEAMRI